jgi:hypothetical protein
MSDTETAQQQINIAGRRGRPVGTTRKTPAELVQNQRDASSKWYYKNHEYRCEQKKIYYLNNRERILESRRQKKEKHTNCTVE